MSSCIPFFIISIKTQNLTFCYQRKDVPPKDKQEKDSNKKRILKEQFDLWAAKYKALLDKRDQYTNLAALKGKMGTDFNKALGEWAGLKKKDASEMISTQEDNLEGQELKQ
jgi:hypothetical protein